MGRPRILLTCLALVLATSATAAPSDLELSAAYCLGVRQVDAGSLSQFKDPDPKCTGLPGADYKAICHKAITATQEARNGIQSDIRRLQTYLLSKGFGVAGNPALGDLLAIKRGSEDAAYWFKRTNDPDPQMTACSERWLSGNASEAWFQSCLSRADPTGTYDRINRCTQVLKELPF
jgi:hypothetical protein